MSRADALLSRLQNVRKTGTGRWISCCPAHEDKHPSLAITDNSKSNDGRLLLHCFAGCDVASVLAAAGLEFEDLYPEPLGDHIKRERRPFNAHDVLACVSFEATVVSVVAAALLRGDTLSDEDRSRLSLASARLTHAADLASGHG